MFKQIFIRQNGTGCFCVYFYPKQRRNKHLGQTNGQTANKKAQTNHYTIPSFWFVTRLYTVKRVIQALMNVKMAGVPMCGYASHFF